MPKPGHELFVSTRVFIVKTANGNYLVAVMLNRSSMSVSNEPSSNNEANLVGALQDFFKVKCNATRSKNQFLPI